MRKLTSTLLSVFLGALLANASTPLTPVQASRHIGERATVCGVVASGHFAIRSRGNPTFLNMERPYPNQIFTVLIWGSDRDKFGAPELEYQGRQICVTGEIRSYRGIPEIVATKPTQITLQGK
jgi:micrococcal nuclease